MVFKGMWKCTRCGYQENIPKEVLLEIEAFRGLHFKVCPQCHKGILGRIYIFSENFDPLIALDNPKVAEAVCVFGYGRMPPLRKKPSRLKRFWNWLTN